MEREERRERERERKREREREREREIFENIEKLKYKKFINKIVYNFVVMLLVITRITTFVICEASLKKYIQYNMLNMLVLVANIGLVGLNSTPPPPYIFLNSCSNGSLSSVR